MSFFDFLEIFESLHLHPSLDEETDAKIAAQIAAQIEVDKDSVRVASGEVEVDPDDELPF